MIEIVFYLLAEDFGKLNDSLYEPNLKIISNYNYDLILSKKQFFHLFGLFFTFILTEVKYNTLFFFALSWSKFRVENEKPQKLYTVSGVPI